MAVNHLARLLEDQPATVSLTVANGMKTLYKQMSGRPGASPFAVSSARRRNWHGPMAWDDIDNPAEQPDVEQVIDLELKRDELAALRRAEIEHLASFNLSNHEIAARLDISISTVNAIVRELHGHQRRARKPAAA